MDWNERMKETYHINWPKKYHLLGVPVSSTTYDEAENIICDAVQQGIPALVDHMPVHGLTLASSEKPFRVLINSFNIVAPDGQPVRWALNLFQMPCLPLPTEIWIFIFSPMWTPIILKRLNQRLILRPHSGS